MKTVLSAFGAIVLAICITQCGSSPIGNPRNLNDLPVEVQLMIYKDLNLKELIHLAKAHPYNQPAIELLFKDKFSKSMFEIKSFKNIIGTIVSRENVVEEIDFELILETIELFGHLIHKLLIYYRPLGSIQKFQMINEYISKHLSESLTEVELLNFFEDYLTELQGPFINAETVVLSQSINDIESNSTNFSKIFPAVRHLRILQYVNPKLLEHHFPQLESIYLQSKRDILENPTIIAQKLKLNPQLRHLRFLAADWDAMEVVSKNLPNLERLEVCEFRVPFDTKGNNTPRRNSDHITTALEMRYPRRNDDIQFKNLKVFTIERSTSIRFDTTPIPNVFGKLEEFSCDMRFNLWIDAIVQNKQLKKLTTGQTKAENIKRVIDELPNLEEITVHSNDYFGLFNNIETFDAIMKEANQLKKFTLLNHNTDTSNAFVNQLTPEWNIEREYIGSELRLTLSRN